MPSETQERDYTCREISIRSSSINEESRSFEAIITTEQVVAVFDYETYRVIDEVLVAKGGKFPNQIPLLNDHERSGAGSVIGSVSAFTLGSDNWTGTGTVGRAVEGNIDRAQIWQDILDGHIRAVSIGYRVKRSETVEKGQSKEIGGVVYKASQERALRVATEWEGLELSITPIGADSKALIRKENISTKPVRRSYFR